MIAKTTYKGRAAIVVESQRLRATVLCDDGAKLASLVDLTDGKELLLTRDTKTYRVLTYNGSYVDSECSGFDDMFPTIDPYTPTEGAYKDIPYLDHGEICRIPHNAELTENAVCLTSHCARLPISYQKTLSVAKDGGLNIHYKITNEGCAPFPYVWAGHIMLCGEDGMQLFTPYKKDAPIEMMFATKGSSPKDLPRDTLSGFDAYRGTAYKFYYLDPISEGQFGIRYSDGRTLRFEYDKQKLPYLGVWINNGEFQGIYNIAPEPCTAPFDSPDRAAKRGYASLIAPNCSFEFTIHISMNS